MAGEHAGHRQRMRERFLQNGLEGFAPHEVLELILCFAIPQRNVNADAHRLLDRFGTLHGVLDAPVEELTKVDGIGPYAATLMSLFSKVARQLEFSRTAELKTVTTRDEMKRYCTLLLSGLRQEQFHLICLNAQSQVIRTVMVSSGTLSEVEAYPRLVVEAALRHNAHGVVLCHNHPSGSPVPSIGDVEVTRRLLGLLGGIEVVLQDHIIVGGADALSMVECGLIEYRPEARELRVADSGQEIVIRKRLENQQKRKMREA